MRFHFQPAAAVAADNRDPTHGNIYREFSSRTYLNGLGLGSSASIQQITAAVGTAASMIPVAGPFIAAAASIAVSIESLFKGCGQTCIEATQIANQVGDLLSTNAHNYVSSPVRTKSMQTAALQVFDNAWSQLVNACGNPQLGQPGQDCISQRQAGGCKWKSSPGGWTVNADGTCTYTWAGPVNSGNTCWNYFVGMRDPIATDPCVIPDPSPFSSSTAAASTGSGSSQLLSPSTLASSVPLPLLLIGGGVLVLMAVTR